MRSPRRRSGLAVVLLALLQAALAAPAGADPPIKNGEIILKFKAGVAQAVKDGILADLGATSIRKFHRIRAEHDRIAGASVAEAIGRYKNHPAVELIEPNYVVSIVRTPDDPLFPQLWGLRNTGQTGGLAGADIRAEQAWNITTGSPDVVVAIIDTGTDYSHPDLAANIYINAGEVAGNGIDDDGNGFVDDVRGWDFANDDNDPIDDNGHGSHVAGTVGAVGDNGIGVTGVNWSVRLMPIKFLSSGGSGSTADAIASIEYATRMGVDVMSSSWGGGAFSEALRLAIQDAGDAGIFFVAAAGNSSSNNDIAPFYPASYDLPNVISIASTDHLDHLSDFSSFGPTSVDLAAPGSNILSTVRGGGYGLLSGTSMATPHVSGILALMKARFPLATLPGLKLRLFASVDVLPSLTGLVATNGRANAFRALAVPDSLPPDPITDLAVVEAGSNTLRIRWTATGDDGGEGTAGAYEIRYASAPLDEDSFGSGTLVTHVPDPRPAGSLEEMEITGLAVTTLYYVAVRALDEMGNPSLLSNVVSSTTLGAPTLSFSPPSIAEALLTGAASHRSVTLGNPGEGWLDFTVEEDRGGPPEPLREFTDMPRGASDARVGDPVVAGSGGPDRFGYRWTDSDQPGGPVFEWVEISEIGTRIPMSALDANFGPIPIGFSFPFYGRTFTTLRACTHGWLSFTSPAIQFLHQPLPNLGAPENLLAVFWKDLNFSGVERAYYHNDGTRFIVEYRDVPGTFGGGPYTFQAILYPNGTIVYQYLTMGTAPFAATVGFQNATRDDGLTIAFNTVYIHDRLAIRIARMPDWFTVSPHSGRIVAPGSTLLDVHLNATDLLGGTYSGAIRIRSNDPLRPSAEIPVELVVTGVADIDLSRSSLEFGAVFVGGARAESLVVTNRGTDVLHVSALTGAPSDFSVTPAAMDLAPGARRSVVVTFRPSTPAAIAGVLTIQSDDPDEGELSVALAGEGLVAPDIDVSPSSLSESLFTGESTSRTLRLGNTGGSDLLFRVDLGEVALSGGGPSSTAPGGTPSEILGHYAEFQAGTAAAAAAVPGPAPPPGVLGIWERIQGSLADSFVIFQDDMEGGAGGWTHAATVPGSTDQWGQTTARSRSGAKSWQVTQHPGAGADALQSQTIDLTGYTSALLSFHHWYDFDDCGGDPFFEPDGGIVEVSSNGGATWSQLTPLGGYPYVLDDICGNPLAFRPAYSHTGGLGAAFIPAVFDLTPYAGGSVRLRFHAGWDCGNCNPNEGWYVDDVVVYSHSPRIVTVLPDEGSVAAGASLDLGVTFDAAGLIGGDYAVDVIVRSNDPDESRVVVPTALHVTGAPDIAWIPGSIDFGPVFVGVAVTDTILVANAGTDVLHVGALATDDSDFTAGSGNFALAPGAARAVPVTFAPSAPTPRTALLTIRSDDADEPEVTVPLQGLGLVPPDIGVDPLSLEAGLRTGETATRTVTVRNTGGSDLAFEVSLSADGASTPGGSPGAPAGSPVAVPDSLGGPTANDTSPSAAPPVVQAVYEGAHLRFGLTSYGEVMPFQSPLGREHLAVGTFLSGYTVAYVSGGVDRVRYALHYARQGIVPVSYQELENTPARVVVEVVTQTVDGVLGIRRLFTFPRDRKFVRVETELRNLSAGAAADVVFKENADWDADSDFFNQWNYDRPRNMVFASSERYVAVASEQVPALMDLFGWNDVDRRHTTVDFPEGPVPGLDGLEVLHFELGALAASQSHRLRAAYGAAESLEELQQVMDEAVRRVPWLSVTPETGAVPPGGSADLLVSFDPGTLPTGDYGASIVLASNDPDEPRVDVAAALHVTGAPVISVEPTSLDFGSIFVGQAQEQTLTVRNTGTDDLLVSGISFDDPSYTANDPGFVIPRSGVRSLLVTFAPSSPGNKAATLSITHNAAGSPTAVALSGTALLPPVLTVDPGSFLVDVPSGESRVETLTLGNAGGSNLTFTLDARVGADSIRVNADPVLPKAAADPRVGGPVTAGAGGPDLHGYRWVDSDQPGGPVFDWVDIAPIGTSIPISGDDQISAPIPIGFPFRFYGSDFTSLRVCTNGFVSFTSSFPSYFNMPLPSTSAPENLLAAFWDDLYFADASRAYYHGDGTRFIVQWSTVFHLFGGGPYTFQVVIYPSGAILYQYQSMAVPLDGCTVGIQNGDQSDGLTVAFNASYVHDGLAIRTSAAPSWLTLDPTSGDVPPAATLPVDVTLDGTGLFPGNYEASIRVASNDPENPSTTVPVRMHVIGIPDLAVSPLLLDFGSPFVGGTVTRTLQVTNLGTDRLEVGSIASGLADFTASPTSFALEPLQGIAVTVTLNAATAGDRSSMLTLASNDPDSPAQVPLVATVLVPPAIVVTPGVIEAAAMPGGRTAKTLSICNQGGSELRFQIAPRVGAGGGAAAPAPFLHVAKGGSDPRPGTLGGGGPDGFGHVWIDSDAPAGPDFDWIDITGTGTPVPFNANADDENRGPFPLPFAFPYYGQLFTQFRVCTNGWISFTSASTSFENQPLPSLDPNVPENLIAPAWDDWILGGAPGSAVYYEAEAGRLVVQFHNMMPYGTFSPSPFDFEVILYPSGQIVYQYLSVGSPISGTSVGMQNGSRDDGINIAFNSSHYLHPNLAVRIEEPARWLDATPRAGAVPAGGCAPVTLDLDAADLDSGDYGATVRVSSNDPAMPLIETGVVLHVGLVEAAASDFDPNTLNLDSNGRFISCRTELPPGLDPSRVVLSSVRFQGTIPVAQDALSIEDYNDNGIPDLRFQFDRAAVEAILSPGDRVPVTVTGEVENTIYFAARDTIRVIRPRLRSPNGGETLLAGSTCLVAWENPEGSEPEYASLHYSTDEGSSWTLIAGDLTGLSYGWIVPSVPSGAVRLRVTLHDSKGVMGYDTSDGAFSILETIAAIPIEAMGAPKEFALRQNNPNPFNPVTVIPVELPLRAEARLEIFRIDGRLVRTLLRGPLPAGRHRVLWDGRDGRGRPLPSGVYIYRLQAGRFGDSKRMLLLK